MKNNEQETLLFLSPPGERVFIRDYFCSKVSQADYLHHPIDFVFLSGLLKHHFHLELIDAIAERLGSEECRSRVQRVHPDIVVGLTGSVSYAEDLVFYRELSERVRCRLVLLGDILLDRRVERLKKLPFVEAFLHDFSGDDLLNYLKGGRQQSDGLENLTFRDKRGVHPLPIARLRGAQFDLPIPDHHLFRDKDYRYPFVRRLPFATVMTDFGCPYQCTFCVMSTLGWKLRSVANVLEELESLGSLGMQELLFMDQTFGIPRKRSLSLLTGMCGSQYRFGWVCFSRPDVVDEELLTHMKRAGCHTVILGLESGSQHILDSANKGYRKDQLLAGFRLCREHRLRTVATVILGLPEETEETFQETMQFLQEVDPDFVSFNVAVPRMGTQLRQEALKSGLISDELEIMDQSGTEVAMPSLALTRSQIGAMRRTAIRQFYFRLSYCVERAARWATSGAVRSDLALQLRQGYGLFRNYLSEGNSAPCTANRLADSRKSDVLEDEFR